MLPNMESWPVEPYEGGFQHEAVAWSGPIKSKHADVPRNCPKLRRVLKAPTYPHPGSYDRLEHIGGNLSDNLLGVPKRSNNYASQLDIISDSGTSINLDTSSTPKRYKNDLKDSESLQVSTRARSPIFVTGKQPSPSSHHPRLPQFSRDNSSDPESEMDERMATVPLIPPGPGPGPSNKSFSRPTTHLVESHFGDFPKPERFEIRREWQKIQKLRESTWSQRSKIHELRIVLREKQLAKSTADDKYLQQVRESYLRLKDENKDISKEQKKLELLAHECERSRDEYGPLEDDCNWLEDQLGRDEFDLTKLEEKFFSLMNNPQDFKIEETMSEVESQAPSAYSDSDVGQDPYHPLVSRFLSKMGDVDILAERLTYLIEEKYSLESEKQTRLLVGHNLAPDDQETLDNYEDAYAKLNKQIEEAKIQAQALKKECLNEGLVDANGNPTDFEKLERQTFMGDVDAGNEKSEYVKYPALIPRPGIQEVRFFDTGPKPDEFSNSAGDHVNQWLLHQLRSSPLQVNMLVRIFEGNFGRIEGERWQIDVVTFWYMDGARKGASGYRVHSSENATRPLRNSESVPSEASLSDLSEHHPSGIFITSSRLRKGFNTEFGPNDSQIKDGILLGTSKAVAFHKSLSV